MNHTTEAIATLDESLARLRHRRHWRTCRVRQRDAQRSMVRTARRSVLPLLRFPFPERRWREHLDATKRIQDQEILITGDDRDAVAGECGRQDDIVVAVATRWGIEYVRCHERERLGEQLKGGPHIDRALPELPLQDFTKLLQQ